MAIVIEKKCAEHSWENKETALLLQSLAETNPIPCVPNPNPAPHYDPAVFHMCEDLGCRVFDSGQNLMCKGGNK